MSVRFQRGPDPTDEELRIRQSYFDGVKAGFQQAIDATIDSERRQPRWAWLRRRRLATTREVLCRAYASRYGVPR